MGCNCGGQAKSGPITYEVVNGSTITPFRSPSAARAAAARDGGQVFRVQDGTRVRI